ncbi:MAG: hypothetical protein PHI34_03790 [Acidobacteriota bacterium]|nr:hypothetical protein [Acidobacteriota bacterium]
MRFKKVIMAAAILGLGLALLGPGAFAQAKKNSFKNLVRTSSELQVQFMDQNCDGLNDLARDHDNDGIPNGQDPDWTRPKDGSGYKAGNGNGGQAGSGMGLGRGGFRGSSGGPFGTGVCDGTGSKGKAARKGR